MLQIHILTLFPQQISNFLKYSIVKRAADKNIVKIKTYALRDFAIDKRGSVDDRPFGGGLGMILRVDVVVPAIRQILTESQVKNNERLIVLFDARGEKFTQKKATEFTKLKELILICGHYEGFDERIKEYVDLTVSIGDFVLTGGEIPAIVVVDAVTRLLPGVLKEGVVESETFTPPNYKEYAQYTRPKEFEGKKVPAILLSGNHEEIKKWREK